MNSIAPPRQVPRELRLALDRELAPGEHIRWSGVPSGRRMMGALGIWIFAIPWTAFALFWESMAFIPWLSSSNTPANISWTFGIIMPLFGLPFVLIGLWMMLAPLRAMHRAQRTVYALTNLRLIRLFVGRKRESTSVLVDRIGPIVRHESKDGWGTLKIQTHSLVDSEGDRTTICFELTSIPDVARLEKLIVDAQPR